MKAVAERLELEHARCALDCGAGDEEVLVGRDRLHGFPGSFRVVRCHGCGLMRTDPRPAPQAIPFYYPEDYHPYRSTLVSGGAPRSGTTALLSLLDTDTRKIPAIPRGRMLEIGCASGSFLHEMADLGWQVEGLEFSATAAAAARALGYPVWTGTVETAPHPHEPYDLIIGWHVFEHLRDPVGALEKFRDWSKKEGWLALSMPDAGSWEFKAFGERWYALQLPTHLYHYTPETLRKVLERGGWRSERLFWHDNPNNLLQSLRYCCIDRDWNGVENYLCEIINGKRHRISRLVLAKLLGAFHASGRMTVWARRI